MSTWEFVVITIINVISLIIFLAIYKEIKHCVKSQILVIGKENQKLVRSPEIRFLYTLYLINIIGLIVLSYYIVS